MSAVSLDLELESIGQLAAAPNIVWRALEPLRPQLRSRSRLVEPLGWRPLLRRCRPSRSPLEEGPALRRLTGWTTTSTSTLPRRHPPATHGCQMKWGEGQKWGQRGSDGQKLTISVVSE